ncbi:hypothetical protein [Shewanella colwelliana]|uniref:hypothetical protein n=1 Tax=Shewanella colwelliana TaxID=23 RepID=UPI0022AEFDD2|nr:hypothetical protein [Shewanella colwelliana]MCZ4337694.1 hypothetical protein [Shewanella colwelliana]
MQNTSKSVFLREQLAPALDLYLDVLAAGDSKGAGEIYESKLMPLEEQLMHDHRAKIFEVFTLNYFNYDCNTSDVLGCQEQMIDSDVYLGGSSAIGSLAGKAFTLRRDLIEDFKLDSLRVLHKHFLMWVDQKLVDTFTAKLEDGTKFQRSHVFGETYSLLELYSPQKSRGNIAEAIDIVESVLNQFAAYSDYELPVNYPLALRRHVETSLNRAMDRDLHPSFYEFFGDGLSWASKPLFRRAINEREFTLNKYADFHAYDRAGLTIPELKFSSEIAAFNNTSNNHHLSNHPAGFTCYALAKQTCLNDLPLADKDADFLARAVCGYIAVSGLHKQAARDVINAVEQVLTARSDFLGSHVAAIIATSMVYYPESNLSTQLIHSLQRNHRLELDQLCVIADVNGENFRVWGFDFKNAVIGEKLRALMHGEGESNAYLRSQWVSTLLEKLVHRPVSTKNEMPELNLYSTPANSL